MCKCMNGGVHMVSYDNQRSELILLLASAPQLSFLLLPSLLHPMGNLLSSGAAAGGKVVLPDGTVRALDCPTSVAEVMLDHPHHFVVDVRSLSAGDSFKATPLPADHMLEIDKAYAVLPMSRGKEGAQMGEWHAKGRAELLLRQYSSRRWRPSLGTIQERGLELEPKKVPHWLF